MIRSTPIVGDLYFFWIYDIHRCLMTYAEIILWALLIIYPKLLVFMGSFHQGLSMKALYCFPRSALSSSIIWFPALKDGSNRSNRSNTHMKGRVDCKLIKYTLQKSLIWFWIYLWGQNWGSFFTTYSQKIYWLSYISGWLNYAEYD